MSGSLGASKRDWGIDGCWWCELVRDDKLAPTERARLRDTYAAQAVDLLHQAVDKGYRDLKDLKEASELNVLRDRDDFKKLLREVEEKLKK